MEWSGDFEVGAILSLATAFISLWQVNPLAKTKQDFKKYKLIT